MKLPEWLASALSDGEGHTSVGRLIALVVVMTCIVMPALIWFELSAFSGHLLEMPGSITGFMAAAGTLAVTLYGITKNAEKAP